MAEVTELQAPSFFRGCLGGLQQGVWPGGKDGFMCWEGKMARAFTTACTVGNPAGAAGFRDGKNFREIPEA